MSTLQHHRLGVRHRLDRLAVATGSAVAAFRARIVDRLAAAGDDERGLTTAEYVALGALVVVAAGAVGALISGFISAKGAKITGTP